MAGRPPKPLALKIAHGDTRKLGAKKFAEKIAGALVVKRGAPPTPGELEPQPEPEGLAGNPTAAAAYAATEKRRWRAKQHYEYLLTSLGRENLLSPMDLGILTGMAWSFALMTEAAESGDLKGYAAVCKAYQDATNLTGLNESSRSKIPKPAGPVVDEVEEALMSGLPMGGDDASVQ